MNERLKRSTSAGLEFRVTGGRLLFRRQDGEPVPDATKREIQAHDAELIGALLGFQSLDDAIIESEAARRPTAEITERAERLADRAGKDDATPLDQMLAVDWRRIREAKARMQKAA